MDSRYSAVVRWGWYGVMLVPLGFLGLFFVFPLGTIFHISIFEGDKQGVNAFADVLTSAYYTRIIGFTVVQAVLSTAITIVLAVPCAYVFARYEFQGKATIMSLATLPFVLPTVVVAAAFSALIGDQGILNDMFDSVLGLRPIQLERTFALILIVHVFYNFSIALRLITTYWMNRSIRIEEAAKVLGCYGWRLWYTIYLPTIRPSIVSASVLVFIFTFTSFGVILILGGPRYATIEVAIYEELVVFSSLSTAAVLSLIQILLMTVFFVFYTRLQRTVTVSLETSRSLTRSIKSKADRLSAMLLVALIVTLLFLPLIALLIRSVFATGSPLQAYLNLWDVDRDSVIGVAPITTVLNSLFFAALTTIGALFLGTLSSYFIASRISALRLSNWFDPLFMLPLATSAVTLGFGYVVALDTPPVNFRSSWVLIPVAHTLVALPFVVRSVLPLLRSIPAQLYESAALLGASPFKVWWHVELPIISRGLVVGATFAFTVSMGEFGASLFIARPEATTMPIAIFRLLSRPGVSNFNQALALSVILMVICLICFLLIERFRSAGVGEF